MKKTFNQEPLRSEEYEFNWFDVKEALISHFKIKNYQPAYNAEFFVDVIDERNFSIHYIVNYEEPSHEDHRNL
jgi:hypothetical protein